MMLKAFLATVAACTIPVSTACSAQPIGSDLPDGWQTVAEDIYLLRTASRPERGPDGNTVVFRGPDGLLVVDTGRHVWHSDAILAFAEQLDLPITAIINTHWHLDHNTGNRRILEAFPEATVYTTPAIERALSPEGFLGRDIDRVRGFNLDDFSEAVRDEIRIFTETMDEPSALLPDISITQSGPLMIAGRTLDVRVTENAVTDADLWLLDPQSGMAVIGDLVTLPVPFFESACPEQWSRALAEVSATDFTAVVPGHGPVMDRSAFETYHAAFDAFVDCVQSDAAADACASVWAERSVPLQEGDSPESVAARANYYVGFLRGNGGTSPDCLVRD